MEGNTMNLESVLGNGHKISNNISTAYNDYKEFEGKKYTGMRVGEPTIGIMREVNGRRRR
jgi:hypothetical protein